MLSESQEGRAAGPCPAHTPLNFQPGLPVIEVQRYLLRADEHIGELMLPLGLCKHRPEIVEALP